jgi:hypothetical protein
MVIGRGYYSEEMSLMRKLWKVLRELQTSSFTFYETGSRFFGVNARKSDYDFFVGLDQVGRGSLEKFLYDLGFREEKVEAYTGDRSIVSVFRHFDHPIDIQIVESAYQKKAAQDTLIRMGITHPTGAQWDALTNLIKKESQL